MICDVARGAVLHITTAPNVGSRSRVCLASGGFMKRAWRAVTVAAFLAAACFGPTTTGVRGTATLGGTPTDQLAFPVQPRSAVAGQIITPAVQLAALDSLGNTDLSFTGAVTVSLGNNPVGGILGGTLT